MTTSRRSLLGAGLAAAILAWGNLALAKPPAGNDGTLRIGMPAAAVPLPNGQADQGGEERRFAGHDLNPHVLSAEVWGSAQARARFQDFTPVGVV